MIRRLVYALLLVVALTIPNASAIVSEKSRSKSGKHLSASRKQKNDHKSKAETQMQNKADAQLLNKVIEGAQSYKDSPSSETYGELWQGFERWVHQLSVRHIDSYSLCKSCQALSKAGLKVIDTAGSGGTVKIYTFSPQAISTQGKLSQNGPQNNPKPELKPLVSSISSTTIESRDILIQSLESTTSEPVQKHRLRSKTKGGRLRAARARKTTSWHTQSLSIPANVEIKQASLLSGSGGKTRFLAILGLDLQSGHSWSEGLKRLNTGWVPDSSIWQQVPSFLLQTGQSKIRLSENNLVITIGNTGAADNNNIRGYELIMPFVENHFALTRNEAQDPARGVALQFLLAVQGKRPDLAKIWLVDSELASIPGYLGLYNRPAGSPALKLISMSPPLNGGARFRLITNSKDDLIVDVGRIKSQWLVKGLYIAPADSLAREIGRILPAAN